MTGRRMTEIVCKSRRLNNVRKVLQCRLICFAIFQNALCNTTGYLSDLQRMRELIGKDIPLVWRNDLGNLGKAGEVRRIEHAVSVSLRVRTLVGRVLFGKS